MKLTINLKKERQEAIRMFSRNSREETDTQERLKDNANRQIYYIKKWKTEVIIKKSGVATYTF